MEQECLTVVALGAETNENRFFLAQPSEGISEAHLQIIHHPTRAIRVALGIHRPVDKSEEFWTPFTPSEIRKADTTRDVIRAVVCACVAGSQIDRGIQEIY